jgi:hypothetical protein
MVRSGPEFESKSGDNIEEGVPMIFLRLSGNMVDKFKYKTNNGQDGVGVTLQAFIWGALGLNLSWGTNYPD